MSWHGYIYLENIALNATQRANLVAALRALGNQTGNHPHLISQFGVRLDNEAAIFEAVFADNDLTVSRVKQYLADVFGISPNQIDHVATSNQYGTLLTLSRGGTDRIRLGMFGGVGASWETSRQATNQYLIDFKGLWDQPNNPLSAPLVRVASRMIPVFTTQVGRWVWERLPDTVKPTGV